MKTNTIDPTSFPTDSPMAKAMRLTSRYWFLAYSKLLSLEWEWTDKVPYGATDGRKLLLNKAGIDKLSKHPKASGLIAFLLVHEALHALLGHGWRLAKLSDRKIANVAADYVINAMIAMRNREIGKEIFPFIEGVLLDEQLSGDKSVIDLYRELVKPQPPQPPQPQPNPDDTDTDDQQDSDPEQGEGDDGDDTDENTDGDGGSNGDTDTDTDTDDGGDAGGDADGEADDESDDEGTGSGTPDHGDADPDSGDDSPDAGDGSGDGETGGEGDDGDLSDFVGTGADDNLEPEAEDGESAEQVIEQIEQDNERILVADSIDRKTSSTSGSTGTRVAGQRDRLQAMDWAILLREWLRKSKRGGWDSPFNAPIYQSTGLVCAGRRTRAAGTVVLVLDTSGSIGQATYNKFLGEAQGVLDELRPEQLVLLSVSHVVADAVILEAGGVVPASLEGGGGTAFQPAFDWLEANYIEPDVMVYLTDGHSSDRTTLKEPDFPLLWLSTSLPASSYTVGEVIPIINA